MWQTLKIIVFYTFLFIILVGLTYVRQGVIRHYYLYKFDQQKYACGFIQQTIGNKLVLLLDKGGYVLIFQKGNTDFMPDLLDINRSYKFYRYKYACINNLNLKVPKFWTKFGVVAIATNSDLLFIRQYPYTIKGRIFYILRRFYQYKSKLFFDIKNFVGVEFAALILSLLFGFDLFLPEYLKQKFYKYNLIHVLVVSGYNFMFISKYIEKLNFLDNIKIRYFLNILTSTVFLLFIGLDPPVVRAYIDIVVKKTLNYLGLPISYFAKLWLVLFIIWLFFPFWLTNISLLLSIMASFGIIYGRVIILGIKGISKIYQKTSHLFVLKILFDNTLDFLGVTLFVFPIIFLTFHSKITFSGFLANILGLPFLDIVIFVGYTFFPLIFLGKFAKHLYLILVSISLSIFLAIIDVINIFF